MWDGSNDYSAGLQDYSTPRKNAALTQKLLSAGMGNIAPYCELSEAPQVESPHTELLLPTAAAITSSPWIISQSYMQKYLGSSRAPLSKFQKIALHTRIALRSGGFFPMAAAILLAFGTLIWKGSPKILIGGNSHPVTQSQESL